MGCWAGCRSRDGSRPNSLCHPVHAAARVSRKHDVIIQELRFGNSETTVVDSNHHRGRGIRRARHYPYHRMFLAWLSSYAGAPKLVAQSCLK